MLRLLQTLHGLRPLHFCFLLRHSSQALEILGPRSEAISRAVSGYPTVQFQAGGRYLRGEARPFAGLVRCSTWAESRADLRNCVGFVGKCDVVHVITSLSPKHLDFYASVVSPASSFQHQPHPNRRNQCCLRSNCSLFSCTWHILNLQLPGCRLLPLTLQRSCRLPA